MDPPFESYKKRSSLKHPEDLSKVCEAKHKSIQFLESIKENDEIEKEKHAVVHKKSEEDFNKQRRESLKNEFKYAQEVLKTQPTDEEDDDMTEESTEVKLNTEHNKKIFEEEY